MAPSLKLLHNQISIPSLPLPTHPGNTKDLTQGSTTMPPSRGFSQKTLI